MHVAGTSTFYTSGTTTTAAEVRQVRLGEAKPHGFGIHRRLAHRRNIKRNMALFLKQLRKSFSLKHSTVFTTQQPLRFLGKRICRHPKGDITVSLERSYYYSMLKHMDLNDNINLDIDTIFAETPSTTRYTTGSRSTSHLPQSCWHAHLGITGTSRPPVHTKGSHQTSCITIGMGLVTSEAHTPVHQREHFADKFLISPRLSQGNSLPLRHLIPLHINTYCDSDWATDIRFEEIYLGHSHISTWSTSCIQQQNAVYSRNIEC